MERREYEFPTGTELAGAPPEAEFQQPVPAREFSPPRAELEFNTPPPEQEFTPPAPELTTTPASDAPRPARRRRKRILFYSAAAMLYAATLLGGSHTPKAPQPAVSVVTPAEVPAETPVPVAESAPAPVETPAPTEAAAPVETPVTTPEPVSLRAVFIAYSDTMEGELRFTGQDRILGVTAQLWDEQIGQAVGGFEIPAEAIAAGSFKLPTLYAYEFYQQYAAEYDALGAWPDPELRLTYRFLNENGEEEEQTVTVQNQHQLGWATRYWDEDADPEWGYPGCFAFSTYESYVPVSVSYSQADPAAPGEITVWLTLNGQDVPAELVRLEPEEEAWPDAEGETVVFYYGNIVVPRPDWAGEHGVAHFTVRQALEGYDTVWVTERDVEY